MFVVASTWLHPNVNLPLYYSWLYFRYALMYRVKHFCLKVSSHGNKTKTQKWRICWESYEPQNDALLFNLQYLFSKRYKKYSRALKLSALVDIMKWRNPSVFSATLLDSHPRGFCPPPSQGLCVEKKMKTLSFFSPSPVILHDVGQPVSHGDNGGQVKQLQQQPLYPGLLAALQATGSLVQNQDSEKHDYD